MENNFTYLRFKQMIMISYLIENGISEKDPVYQKHLDLLQYRFDSGAFTHETVDQYRIKLFTELQEEVNDWNAVRQMTGQDMA